MFEFLSILFSYFNIRVIIQLVSLLGCILLLLGSVAFCTLLERRAIAVLQNRRGPNRNGFFGLIQALADGMKLVTKSQVSKKQISMMFYYFAPFAALFLSWFLAFYTAFFSFDDFSLYFLLIWTSLNVYSLPIAGIVTAHSKFAYLGGIRSLAQLLSYELSLSVLFLILVVYTNSPILGEIIEFQHAHMSLAWSCFPVFLLWFIVILAETNRVPFDLPEAEAELVAGFATEYSSFAFAAFFLAEYGSMLVYAYLTSVLFFGNFNSYFSSVFFFFCFVWIRTTLPRFKVDQLLWLGWFCLLPLSLVLFVVYFFHLSFFTLFISFFTDCFAYLASFFSTSLLIGFSSKKHVCSYSTKNNHGDGLNKKQHTFSLTVEDRAFRLFERSMLFLESVFENAVLASELWIIVPLLGAFSGLIHLGTSLLTGDLQLYSLRLFSCFETHTVTGFNALGLMLYILSCFVLTMVCIRNKRLSGLAGCFSVFLLLLFFTRDLFIFFIAFEGMLLPTLYLLHKNKPSLDFPRAGLILVLYSFFTMLFFLFVTVYTVKLVGTSDLEMIRYFVYYTDYQVPCVVLRRLFFFAFAFKMSLVPLHVWLPKAHVEGDLSMSWILGGVVLKAALFGIYTCCISLFPVDHLDPLFVLVCLIGMFLPLFIAVTEAHLKRMVAYFSISHMSFAVLLLLNYSPTMLIEEAHLCVVAMLLGAVHTFVSNSLFFLVDFLYQDTKTKNLLLLSEFDKKPLLTMVFLFFMLDNVGCMPFSYNFFLEASSVMLLASSGNFFMVFLVSFYLLFSAFVGLLQLIHSWRVVKRERSKVKGFASKIYYESVADYFMIALVHLVYISCCFLLLDLVSKLYYSLKLSLF